MPDLDCIKNCDVSKTLNGTHSSLSVFFQSFFSLYSFLKCTVEYNNMGGLLIYTILERSSMEERFENIMLGFSCAT